MSCYTGVDLSIDSADKVISIHIKLKCKNDCLPHCVFLNIVGIQFDENIKTSFTFQELSKSKTSFTFLTLFELTVLNLEQNKDCNDRFSNFVPFIKYTTSHSVYTSQALRGQTHLESNLTILRTPFYEAGHLADS